MPIFTYPLRPEASCQYPMNPFLEAFLAPALAAAASAEKQQQQQPKEKKPTNPSPRPQSVLKPAPTPRYHNRSLRSFEPHFDAYETADSYIVEGNLPGLADKKNLDLEFSDDRTLLIRGRIERPALPTSTLEPASPATEQKRLEETREKRRSLNATVEDTDDEEDFTVVKRTDSSSSLASEGKKAEKKESVEKKQEPATKTLLSERVFGSFQRTFAFPATVDLDHVSASLEHGVLRVTVPKGFHGSRRIEVV